MAIYSNGQVGWFSGILPPDADAQAFITAANITNITQQSAIDTLVKSLKSANIWTKMKAVYPFVGGTAAQHRFNLKSPGTTAADFYLDFNGGGTHGPNGYQPNGNSYADTKLNVSLNMNRNSTHLSYYSTTDNAAGSTGEIGALTTSPVQYSHMHLYYTGGSFINRFMPIINTTVVESSNIMTNSIGHYIGNRATNKIIVAYKNGALVMLANNNDSATLPNLNYYIGALNINGSPSNYTSRNCAFASIGDGLTDSEASAFYTAVQTFQTTLGRQV